LNIFHASTILKIPKTCKKLNVSGFYQASINHKGVSVPLAA